MAATDSTPVKGEPVPGEHPDRGTVADFEKGPSATTAGKMVAWLVSHPIQAFSSLTALGRIGTVEDVAAAAAFLASPDSGWVTGQYVEASGGLGMVTPGFGSD